MPEDAGAPSALKKETEPGKRAMVKWSEAEDTLVVDILLEEKSLGGMSDNGWKRQVWIKVVEKLKREIPGSGDKTAEKTKSRYERVSWTRFS
ncbi:MAG TPA: hypothetical protein VGO47_06775 [Chlamydiales bacterium]|nr:hypothetical protein [Chlamydiales bacterium]